MHKFSNRGLLKGAVLGHPNLAAALPVPQADEILTDILNSKWATLEPRDRNLAPGFVKIAFTAGGSSQTAAQFLFSANLP
jgi:hypothetical protein